MNRVTIYKRLNATKRMNLHKAIVGVVQSRSTANREENFENNKRLIDDCVDKGASLVCLPECFAFMDHPQYPSEWSEPLDGPTIKKYAKLAIDN